MRATVVVTAVDVECDAVADGVGEPQAVTVGPYTHARRCETEGADVLVVAGGVGPAAAAAASAYLVATRPVGCLVSMGIAGAFASGGLGLGALAVADRVIAADLGARGPEGFLDLAAMGLDGGGALSCDPRLVAAGGERLTAAGLEVAIGALLTVSTSTGTDERAEELTRTHAPLAEAMEGAGVAHVGALHGVPVLEVRAISNMVGVRDPRTWDILGALTALTAAAAALLRPGL